MLLKKFQNLSNCEKENYIERIQIIQEFADKQSMMLSSHSQDSIQKFFDQISLMTQIFVREIHDIHVLEVS